MIGLSQCDLSKRNHHPPVLAVSFQRGLPKGLRCFFSLNVTAVLLLATAVFAAAIEPALADTTTLVPRHTMVPALTSYNASLDMIGQDTQEAICGVDYVPFRCITSNLFVHI
jgi:hypothetical protein